MSAAKYLLGSLALWKNWDQSSELRNCLTEESISECNSSRDVGVGLEGATGTEGITREGATKRIFKLAGGVSAKANWHMQEKLPTVVR